MKMAIWKPRWGTWPDTRPQCFDLVPKQWETDFCYTGHTGDSILLWHLLPSPWICSLEKNMYPVATETPQQNHNILAVYPVLGPQEPAITFSPLLRFALHGDFGINLWNPAISLEDRGTAHAHWYLGSQGPIEGTGSRNTSCREAAAGPEQEALGEVIKTALIFLLKGVCPRSTEHPQHLDPGF